MVFFGTGLDKDQLILDSDFRERILEEGITAINDNIEGIRLVTQNKLACMATWSGPSSAIDRLKHFVEGNETWAIHLGVFEERPLRGAAKKN